MNCCRVMIGTTNQEHRIPGKYKPHLHYAITYYAMRSYAKSCYVKVKFMIPRTVRALQTLTLSGGCALLVKVRCLQLYLVDYGDDAASEGRCGIPLRKFFQDASNHVEAPALHQTEAVGDDDAPIDPEEEDPTEVFTEEEDDETDSL
ncbi:hypothetical protein TIFTF001_026272 [Ficus carica]|uniref:Uncharacterized protein n=1 Tax=Ficus carica TaxID=3494 RepID=A0AA88DKX6_FICCA|nr:hypothetical protein TIFTF001_026272 [Ficus carica]